ncbi:hypothetical protein PHYPSEUDO_008771 [Phytophthora pseudosyringae]|uniref:Uncharacterized protein n=1 Tax=Phytophthora pseudosyringae TaxID=221518 RepID=A0A8T1VDU6_9STRA|nr:hypothetical protein PHYPSEUDO_008771 [Phytophthora pseudosyringae]
MDDDSRMSETSSVRNRGQRHAASTAGDLDGSGDAVALSASHIRPQLRCNACWEPILPDAQSAETCYRTSCGHLFCVGCCVCVPLYAWSSVLMLLCVVGKFQLAQDSFRQVRIVVDVLNPASLRTLTSRDFTSIGSATRVKNSDHAAENSAPSFSTSGIPLEKTDIPYVNGARFIKR